MVTHNNDCEDCDVRVGIVPEQSHDKGSTVSIHQSAFTFPRYVGNERGLIYTLKATEQEHLDGWAPNETKAMGSIPQVAHTYQYIEGTYGIMNSEGLAMGESTCAAKIAAYSIKAGGDALFDISALMRIALQRCATAVCAIDLMGSLAEQHGYYGSEDPVESGDSLFEVAGEAVTIIDRREAWIMHMLADRSGKSAIWAAQRVPDDHLAVVPNKFVIQSMNLSDTHTFKASKDIRLKAIEAGFLDKETSEKQGGDEAFDFSAAFSLREASTEIGPNDSNQVRISRRARSEHERRRWRIFSTVAPALGLQAEQEEHFPFSVKVEKPVHVEDIMALMRDHYEGTPYDQTRGLAAGPYGNPNRYDTDVELHPKSRQGWFERTISIHRTSYSLVAQVRGVADEEESKNDGEEEEATTPADAGVVWFAHHSPHNSLYMPLYSSATSLPDSFARGSLYRFDRASAWWAFAAVSNNAERMYAPIHAHIAKEQSHLEQAARQRVKQLDARVAQLQKQGKNQLARELTTKFTVEHSQSLVDRWWLLLDEITTKFRDGVIMRSHHPPLKQEHVFYPHWWLKEVGYFSHGPMPKPNYPTIPVPNHQIPFTTQMQHPAAIAKQQQGTQQPTEVVAQNTVLYEQKSDDGDAADDKDEEGSNHNSTRRLRSGGDDEPHYRHASGHPNPLKNPLAITLFISGVIITGIILFQLCKIWRNRRREAREHPYEEVRTQERFEPLEGDRVRLTVR